MASGFLFGRATCAEGVVVCEESSATINRMIGIVVGSIAGGLVAIVLCLLAFFHFRRQRRDKEEWGKDQQELEDYGIQPSSRPAAAVPAAPAANYRAPKVDEDEDDEASPRLSPPRRRGSHDSLNSLARSIRQPENPFGGKAEVIGDGTRVGRGANAV